MRLSTLYAFLLLVITSTSIYAQQETPLMVGVADTNGVIMPFAVYDGKQWSNPWPQEEYDGTSRIQQESVYTTLGKIPKSWYAPLNAIPEKWNIVQSGGKTGIINITRPALVFSHCFQRWALIGEKSKKENVGKIGDFYRLAPTLFLATTIHQQRSNITIPDKESDEYQEIYNAINSAITTYESAAKHPIPVGERDIVKTELLTIARNETIQNGSFIYYVEAKKDYEKNRSNPCISYFNGWILKNSTNQLSFIRREFNIYRNEMMHLSSDRVFGVLTLDARSYWIIRDRGYEGESWLILDVSPSGTTPTLKVSGGGC
jgi:hypothetical protein